MIEQKSQPDSNETPEDVATLYSWANLHGAKYRDFSSSRAVAREESRLRVEAAQEAERQRVAEEAERLRQEEVQLAARKAAEEAERARQEEAERLAEIARQAEAERQAVLAAQEAQRQAALQRTWEPPPPEAYLGGYTTSHAAAIDFEQSPYAHDFSQSAEPEFPEPAAFIPRFEELSERFRSAPPQAPVQHYSEAERSQPTPLVHSPVQQQFPLPGLASGVDSNAYRAPRQNIERPQEPTAQPTETLSQSGAPQPHQPWPGAKPTQSAAPQPIQVTYSQPAQNPYPDSRPDQRFATNPQNAAGYEPFTEPPAQEFGEADYGHPSQDQPATFRPAWLAPLPAASQPAVIQAPQQPRHPAPPVPSVPSQRFVSPPTEQYQQYAGLTPSQSSIAKPAAQPTPRASASNLYEANISDPREPVAREQAANEAGSNRWYALRSVFDIEAAPAEPVPPASVARAPVLAIFSLAGGVGKTSLVASLGRALSSRGEHVLLVDTAAYGLLPFFFGARDQRPGQLRTFNPPGTSVEAPIQLVTLDPEGQAPESQPKNAPQEAGKDASQDWLAQEVARYSRGGVNRVLIDLPTASGSTTRRVLRLDPTVLVPILPDMNSVVSVGAIEAFFRHNGNVNGKQIMPYYVLNQFDYTSPLHLDVRQILKDQVGDRLLGFAIRRSSVVSEALAEGMTVTDYAPTATIAEDYANLAGWVRSLAAPVAQMNRGVRWSER